MKRTILFVFIFILCCGISEAKVKRPVKNLKNAGTAAVDTSAVLTDSTLAIKSPAVEYTDEFLDSVVIDDKLNINNYALIGVEYGGSFNRMNFNPKYKQETFFTPGYVGVTFTKYAKFFGRMPYFGFQVGFNYGHNGYKFKEDIETHTINTINGAEQVIYDFVEMPLLSAFHIDMNHFKILANLGPYVGYRLNIHRYGEFVEPEIAETFLDTDHRWDFGIMGGAGFGLVFDPVELHITAELRYAFGNIYDPDYASKDYYRYAYPFDVVVKAGLYFQLSKRTGRSKAMLKKEARTIVFGE